MHGCLLAKAQHARGCYLKPAAGVCRQPPSSSIVFFVSCRALHCHDKLPSAPSCPAAATSCPPKRTVVPQEAHGLGQGPLGHGVCGEAAVVDGKGGGEALVGKVLEEAAHCSTGRGGAVAINCGAGAVLRNAEMLPSCSRGCLLHCRQHPAPSTHLRWS